MSQNQPLILSFSEINRRDLPIVGGKGANLGEMTQAGFPVPPGFCVTTATFEQFMASSGQSKELYAALESITLGDLETTRKIGQQIRASLKTVPVPDEIATAVVSMWQAQGSELAYAVRSSATAEDLPDASFAGQQDTYLNVIGENALLTAVRDCWISLFTDRAILYRIQNGFDHRQVALSVVVQQMVLPEVSGIMFTADPLSGERHICTIDASYGLGEALVAGLVSADLYKIDRRTYTITNIQIADKQLAVRPLPEGGTVEEAITGSARTVQVLSETQAIQLAEIGGRIARHYGQPQDIEWALTGDEFTILQSRPITSLFPIPEEAVRMEKKTGELQVMFSFASVQGVMGAITPLGQDTIRHLFARSGVLFDLDRDIHSQQVIYSAAERLWVNFTTLIRHPVGRKIFRAAMPLIDPGAASAVETLVGDPRLTPDRGWFKLRTVRRAGRFLLPLIARIIRMMRHPNSWRDAAGQEAETYFQKVKAKSEAISTLSQRMALFYGPDGIIASGFATMLPLLLPPIVGGMSSLNLLNKLAAGLPPETPNVLILTRGLPHNVTTEMDLALWQTAKTIGADEASTTIFSHKDGSALSQAYLAGALPPVAQTAVAQFMSQYGMRGLGEIDIGQPRWREDPLHIMQVLQSYLQIDDPALAPDVVFARGAAEAEAAIEPLAAAVRQTKFGRIKARLVPVAARRLRALAGGREKPKFMIVRLFGLVRAGLLDSGKQLAAAGTIQQAEDLFYLTVDELNALAAGEERDWIEIISASRARQERELGRKLIPRLLLSDGRAFYEGVSEERETADIAEGALVGSPVSPGVVEGIVHIVFNPHESQLAAGEILVCPGTDPAWTPLFLAARGLVMEVGGLMTHGSVVAREYGIPAVAGVTDVTTRLKTGQRIRVDGTAGTVEILHNGDKSPLD
jgi:pyruvate,water dikinase